MSSNDNNSDDSELSEPDREDLDEPLAADDDADRLDCDDETERDDEHDEEEPEPEVEEDEVVPLVDEAMADGETGAGGCR